MYQLVLPDVLCRSPIVICKKKTKDLFSYELNIFSNYWCSRNMTPPKHNVTVSNYLHRMAMELNCVKGNNTIPEL